MASEDSLRDGVPRLRAAIVRRLAEAVYRIAKSTKPMMPLTAQTHLAKTLQSATASLERHVRNSRSATERARVDRDSLADILELLDRAVALARVRCGSERLESVAMVLRMTRSHIGLALEEAETRMTELRDLGRFLETGAANSAAATSLAPESATRSPAVVSVWKSDARMEIGEDVIRYTLKIPRKVPGEGDDIRGETQI